MVGKQIASDVALIDFESRKRSCSPNFILLSFAPQVKEDLQLFNDTAKNSFSRLRENFKAKPIKYEIIPTCEVRKPRKDSKYRYVMPECDSVVKDFKVNGYPLVLIVDKKGFIRYIHEGFIQDPAGAEYLLNLYKTEIDSLLTN